MDTQYTKERHTLLWTLLKKNAPALYKQLAYKKINAIKSKGIPDTGNHSSPSSEGSGVKRDNTPDAHTNSSKLITQPTLT